MRPSVSVTLHASDSIRLAQDTYPISLYCILDLPGTDTTDGECNDGPTVCQDAKSMVVPSRRRTMA